MKVRLLSRTILKRFRNQHEKIGLLSVKWNNFSLSRVTWSIIPLDTKTKTILLATRQDTRVSTYKGEYDTASGGGRPPDIVVISDERMKTAFTHTLCESLTSAQPKNR